ncbi:MAG: DUF4956 domain-containing protein [Candidatus Sabulitectum sp.]|nr:DUF4956 domain-containing protein [Candidatus Sabulitectum sp.]
MSALTLWFNTTSEVLGYSPGDLLINLFLALASGLIIGIVYKATHRGLTYSQNFVVTLVLMCITVSAVMMVIGSNLARAFALVGALTIVRFRTVIKDTRDTAFVFFALTEGIASGTGNYLLSAISTAFISAVALILFKTNFGSYMRSEYVIRFRFDRDSGIEAVYAKLIGEKTSRSALIHIEPSDNGRYLTLSYDITLKRGVTAASLVSAIEKTAGLDRVSLVSSMEDSEF